MRTPRRTLPVALLKPLVLGDYLSAKLLRTERQLTKDMIPEFAGKQSWCSSAKAIGELGWKPRPVAESVHDTVWWILDQFVDTPDPGRRA